ncbi:MAG: DUF3048 domain-containing protein [Patescibacteria group bacterium]|nr:DUF3048 domain-containing protein [Patescibacteria group bacterium]MDD5567255.1 DUF3048 domain-containing protein [Patescibacteria group bacterium]
MKPQNKDQNKAKSKAGKSPSQWFILGGFFVFASALSWVLIYLLIHYYLGTTKNVLASNSKSENSAEVTQQVGDKVARRSDGVLVAPEHANPYPVAIMIDNIPPAWPQSGLEAASIFYETLVEGGATRIMAVFTGGTSEKIGPVRSARPYYIEWVSEYDAFYGHVGGSPDALAAISGLGIKDFSQFSNGQYFWRDQERYAPHNVYTSTELINRALRDKQIDVKTPDYRSWKFKDEASLSNRPSKNETITVKFSSGQTWTSTYEYDLETNSYLKSQANNPHLDAETGNQLKLKNVIVIIVPKISDYGEKGRITLNITGEGKAYIFRDGLKIEGTWKKPDRLSRTIFYDETGQEISLNRGTSWVSIVPEDKEVLYSEKDL